jgi:hypothetical protein
MPTFISHKSDDIGIYSAVCLALAGAGIQCWDPSKMSRGESLAEQLRDAIRKCEVCVFIATRRSIDSPWCLAELGAFWGAGKRVLLYIGDSDLTDSMLPPQFKGDLRVNTAQELIEAVSVAIEGGSNPTAFATASAEIIILNDRTHLYEKTAEVLRNTKRIVLDTTWGPSARKPDSVQSVALKKYLQERSRARERGVECHELFSPKGRESRIESAKKECEKGNLLIKVIDSELPYMPDFLVADTEHVIISNVGASRPGKYKYVYLRSEGLAQLFHDWYWEIWKLPGEEIGRRPDNSDDETFAPDDNNA